MLKISNEFERAIAKNKSISNKTKPKTPTVHQKTFYGN